MPYLEQPHYNKMTGSLSSRACLLKKFSFSQGKIPTCAHIFSAYLQGAELLELYSPTLSPKMIEWTPDQKFFLAQSEHPDPCKFPKNYPINIDIP